MKRIFLVSGLTMIALLLISGAGADGTNEHGSKFMNDGFQTRTDFMEVNGSLDITDEGIVISMVMAPNAEAMKMMEKRNQLGDKDMSDGEMAERPMDRFSGDINRASSFQNSMNVTLYAIIEFEESGTLGYDNSDTILSIYYLNSSTLEPLSDDGNGNYTVTSGDGVFTMSLVANSSDLGALNWKWSVEIEYPYVSNSSSIALLHDVQSMRNEFNMRRDMGEHKTPPKMGSGTDRAKMEVLKNNTMMNEGEGAPMFLSWVETANVDGSEMPIVATAGDGFAIAIPHGASIFYDPAIGVQTSVVSDMDNSLSLLNAETSSNTANFPYLALGISALVIATFVTRRRV